MTGPLARHLRTGVFWAWTASWALPLQAAAPAPTAAPTQPSDADAGGARVITIHKPLIPAAWGRVIQYHEEQALLNGGVRETRYEFVLQDDQGLVRTATYHESSDGTGYWEVYVWDEP